MENKEIAENRKHEAAINQLSNEDKKAIEDIDEEMEMKADLRRKYGY